jgi:hypothetical protein
VSVCSKINVEVAQVPADLSKGTIPVLQLLAVTPHALIVNKKHEPLAVMSAFCQAPFKRDGAPCLLLRRYVYIR